MRVSTKLAKNQYTYNKDNITHLLVELTAPKVEWYKDRAPICVVPVLDVSGSMFGSKLDYVKKACRKLVDNLSANDFAGIVAYDSSVYEVAKIGEITQSKKDEMKVAIDKLSAGSCTNLSGGLITALKWVNNTDFPKNVVLRIIVFTDGLANVGIADRKLLNFIEEHKGRSSVSCFGFGSDTDQELLADISNRGEGNYAFIDSPDAAMSAFARELGGLMSTYAQNISVRVSPDNNNEIVEVLNDENVEQDGKAAAVKLRDILCEEQKFLVFNVKLGNVNKPLPRSVVAFNHVVSWEDKDGNSHSSEGTTKVKFCKEDEEPVAEDKDVVACRDRLLAACAQDKADRLAKCGDYIGARSIMENCFNLVSDEGVKRTVSYLTSNYANSQSYGASRGISSSVKKGLFGKRVAYTSNVATVALGDIKIGTSAMDDMENTFNTDKTDENQSSGSLDKKTSGKDW